ARRNDRLLRYANKMICPVDTPSSWPVPPPKVGGGDVLYLDFDGVLHHKHVLVDPSRGLYFGPEAYWDGRTPRLFEHANLLAQLLEPYPHVRIVLSTSWARRSFRFARSYLPEPLAQRCVGATYHSRMERPLFDAASRGMQVWSDVLRREPRCWLALDDDPFDWPVWCQDRLVLVRNDLE